MSSDKPFEQIQAKENVDHKHMTFAAAAASDAWAPTAKASDFQPAQNKIPEIESPAPLSVDDVLKAAKQYAEPRNLSFMTLMGRHAGMELAEKQFGKGELAYSSSIGRLNISGHENQMTAMKFLALPSAAAAAYSFSRDFESLQHSNSVKDTAWASAALASDSVALAGSLSTFVPKVKWFSSAIQTVGFASRIAIGKLDE